MPCAPGRAPSHEPLQQPTTGHLRVAFLFLEEALTPLNPVVDALTCRLDDTLRDLFEELAGVMQFEVGKERELAEALALLDVLRMHPQAVSGVVLLEGQLAGTPVFVLATDDGAARAHLDTLGAAGVAVGDLGRAVSSLGGAARLTALHPRTPEN